MADKKLNLKIITQARVLVDDQVDSVYSKAVDGDIGILPDHVPYMTALDIAVTKYVKGNTTEFVSTIGGIFQVSDNNVTILSDTAELGEEIDLARAKAAKDRAEARLGTAAKDIDVNRAEAALTRAIARIHAATKMRPGS
jgi:F-type H+-transporting ATPase subunit epsilon